MKIAYFMFALATIGMVATAGKVDCQNWLTQYMDASCNNNKCIMMAATGLAGDGNHLTFKGNLKYSNDALRVVDKLNILTSANYKCNANNKYQPFHADNVFSVSQFNIFRNGSAQAGNEMVSLVCVEEHGNIFTMTVENIRYSFVLMIRDSCESIHFGESCSTTTPTPTATPTETPTETPTSTPTGSPSNLVIEVTVKNSWVTNGVEYSQFNVAVKNNGNEQMNHMVMGFTNFNPTEMWNIDILPNGDLSMPSDGHVPPNGGTFEWGFVARSDSQHQFTIKSASN